MSRLRRHTSVAFLATLVVSGNAGADTPRQECPAAAEDAQALREVGQLRAAREKLLRCAQQECPPVVRTDCIRWLAETEIAMPTIVVEARDARGNDIVGVEVIVDGERLVASLDGRPLPLDPGPHRVRCVAASGDIEEKDVLVPQGEKGRRIIVRFRRNLGTDGSVDLSTEKAGSASQTGETISTQPAPAPRSYAPWIVGAAGVALVGVGALFDLRAWGVQSGCGATRSCTTDEVDTAKTDRAVAVISLAVGGTAVLAAAAWLLLAPTPRKTPQRSSLSFDPAGAWQW